MANRYSNDRGYRRFFAVILLIMLLSAWPAAVYAAGGDGTGPLVNGVFKPLGLTSATLEDGTNAMDHQNVPLKPKFTLHFDKNVVYLIYWSRNKECFHLYDDEEKEVPISVTKIDDTVDFSKRQYIWVEPVEPLKPGTNYRLYVAPDLIAKNGGSLLASTTDGKGLTIRFKTAGEKAAAGPVTPVQTEPEQVNPVQTAPEQATPTMPESVVTEPAATEPGATEPESPVTESASADPDTVKPAAAESEQPAPAPETVQKSGDAHEPVQESGYTPSPQAIFAKYFAWVCLAIIGAWIIYEILRRRKNRDNRGAE
ncbi:hypothetical protein Dhaf_1703 [Desulfitobacterium hafniense DCB-2]|uniref:SbsA Ig-like domain-containing protein n=1 Tax=Desulfitobacterium hafniense (strain DSM 10664 / DCB-2) TaxID=272564 RepID=B8FPT5_DESHD|nr:hypothetical protein [Desulfitobacterium hafniense]ACL19749.1 hypothetical protein Dhaf_1703 [Desulfitobacterium hafniense DCB-2]